ncbi:MAG: hypothetical protein AAB721_02890 [Patescibacteria group bacterium]
MDQCNPCGADGGAAGGVAGGAGGGTSGSLTLNVRMRNEYAESIFTVDVTIEAPTDGGTISIGEPAGTKKRVFDNERIAGSAFKVSTTTLNADPRAVLFLEIVGTSLGRQHAFSGREPVSDSGSNRTLGLVYDYDLALASFRLRYGWLP